MATQLGQPPAEAAGRRTRDRPVQSYRDLMNPLRSKDYITGKKGLPRSERNLTTSNETGSVPASPAEDSFSDNSTWPAQSGKKPSRNLKWQQNLEDDSSPELHSLNGPFHVASVAGRMSRAESHPQNALQARIDTSKGKQLLIISGLKPFHWTRFTPQVHLFQDARHSTRRANVRSEPDPVPELLEDAATTPASPSAQLQEEFLAEIKDSPVVPLPKLSAATEERPGLIRLSLKRKLPVPPVELENEATIILPDPVVVHPDAEDKPVSIETAESATKALSLSTVAAGKQPSSGSPEAQNVDNDGDPESDSDTTSESSDDGDLTVWELPLAYGDYELPAEEDCEDAADLVLRSHYRSLPDATAFAATLSRKIEKRSTADLYKMVQGANEILQLWQDEYIKLDRITAPHSITQRRPVLGGRVPIEPQIYEDVKESILYDYVYDPRKPPGFQDPVTQKAKSATLSRELRQRRKRKLDLVQDDEMPIEPYRTRRQVAASSQPTADTLEAQRSPTDKSSPKEAQDVQGLRKRGRPNRDRDEPRETVSTRGGGPARGRGRGAGRTAGRARGRLPVKGRIRSGLAIRLDDDVDAAASEDMTGDEAILLPKSAQHHDTFRLSDVTSQAFDRARESSVQRATKPVVPVDLKGKKTNAKVRVIPTASDAKSTLPAKDSSASGAKPKPAPKRLGATAGSHATAALKKPIEVNKQLLNVPITLSSVQTQAQAAAARVTDPAPKKDNAGTTTPQAVPPAALVPGNVKPIAKRKKTKTPAKDAIENPAASASTAPTVPKGKRKRAVSTNASYPGRGIIPLQLQSRAHEPQQPQITASSNAEAAHIPLPPFTWPAHVPGHGQQPANPASLGYNAPAFRVQPISVSNSGTATPSEYQHKGQGIKIRMPPRKKSKGEPIHHPGDANVSRLSTGLNEDVRSTAYASSSRNQLQEGPSAISSRTPTSQTAAQAASARLTQSLMDHAAQRPKHEDSSRASVEGGANPPITSNQPPESPGDPAGSASAAANAQKVDKRRLKKPPSQLRSETMTKWWADRKAKKLAEKESLKNLQARSQERMLLAGDASRPPVNPFMLGERPLLAYTPLSHEGQSGAPMVPSPTSAIPPRSNVFPRPPIDATATTPSQYPYSAQTPVSDGRSPPSTYPARGDYRDSYKPSPSRPKSPRSKPMQSAFARPDYNTPGGPMSPIEPFRPPTLPSLSQITHPSYQPNGSGSETVATHSRSESFDMRSQNTYPPPPPPPIQLRPIETSSDLKTQPPSVYPHNPNRRPSYDQPGYDQPTYPPNHGSRHGLPQQYSTWPPAPNAALQQPPSYYPPRAPVLPSPQARAFDQHNSNVASPHPSGERPRHDDYPSYTQYPPHPPQPSSHATSSSQSYWPPVPPQSYQHPRSPPPPATSSYPPQQSQNQYPPSQPMDRPPMDRPQISRLRSPTHEPSRYGPNAVPRYDSRFYNEADRNSPMSTGPPIDPELLG